MYGDRCECCADGGDSAKPWPATASLSHAAAAATAATAAAAATQV